jgi:hypothetical protein
MSLDAFGWPTTLGQTTNAQGQVLLQAVSTSMLGSMNGQYPSGLYHAAWDGTGTLTWGGDVRIVQQGTIHGDQHYATLSDVAPSNQGIFLRIDATSPSDPIRDIHVWLPDYNGQSFVGQVWQPGAGFSPFYPPFLQLLNPFHTLRFTQDASIVTSEVQQWTDLRPVQYATQVTGVGPLRNGMAPQYMIELCNELNADLWVNIPHMADDNFIATYATLVRDTLKPNLKVYVEWSHEVWNSAPGDMPYQWIEQQLALPQNAGITFPQFVAREDTRTFDIWSQAFAGQTNRLVRTVGGIAGSPRYTAAVLQNMSGDFDAVAVTAYLSPASSQLATYSASTTADQVLSDLTADIPTAISLLEQTKALADQYSSSLGRQISLLAYEGGPSLIGKNQPYQAAFSQATTNAGMYNVYSQFLVGLNQAGLGLLVNFEFTDAPNSVSPNGGAFGSLSSLYQPLSAAPKYQALLDAASGSLFAVPARAPSQAHLAHPTLPAGSAILRFLKVLPTQRAAPSSGTGSSWL